MDQGKFPPSSSSSILVEPWQSSVTLSGARVPFVLSLHPEGHALHSPIRGSPRSRWYVEQRTQVLAYYCGSTPLLKFAFPPLRGRVEALGIISGHLLFFAPLVVLLVESLKISSSLESVDPPRGRGRSKSSGIFERSSFHQKSMP